MLAHGPRIRLALGLGRNLAAVPELAAFADSVVPSGKVTISGTVVVVPLAKVMILVA